MRKAPGSIPSIVCTTAHSVRDSCQTTWAFQTEVQGVLHVMLRAKRLQKTTKNSVVLQCAYFVCPTWKAEVAPDIWKTAGSKLLFLHKKVNGKQQGG